MPTYQGSCHCGRVKFEFEAAPTHLSRCNGSLCAAKGALYLPAREIRAFRIVAGESDLAAYPFNTRTATHTVLQGLRLQALRHPHVPPPAHESSPMERQRAHPLGPGSANPSGTGV